MRVFTHLIIATFLFTACKKSDGGIDLPVNSFTIGGTTYNATEFTKQNLYWGTGNGYGSGISLTFSNPGYPAGQYKIYNPHTTNTSTDNYVSVRARLRDNHGQIISDYITTGNEGGTVNVTNSNGYTFIGIPKVWALNVQVGQQSDSIEVSAYLKTSL